MAKKPSAQFKRFSNAMKKIVRVSKDELAKREALHKERLGKKKTTKPTAPDPPADNDEKILGS